MDLHETLYLVAAQLKIDGDKLIEYALEDTETGWDKGEGDWEIGSLWAVEGRTLYALIRYLVPGIVVEIGTHQGCSANHIKAALEANDNGMLYTVDMAQRLVSDDWIEAVSGSGVDYLQTLDDNSVSMIFEDADHSAETCRDVAIEAARVLKPGGVLVMHDAAHFLAGEHVRSGLDQSGINYRVYLTAPSDCGLAIWQKPGAVLNGNGLPHTDEIYEQLKVNLEAKKPVRRQRKQKAKAV